MLSLLTLIGASSGCEAFNRARATVEGAPADSLSATGTGSGLVLGLQVPGALAAGDEGVLRLSVTNRSDTVASRIRLELIIPGWVEPMPPRPGDREVSIAAMSDGGIRFAYQLADTPLAPNRTQTIEQRIRVPSTGPMTEGAVPWTRLIRARLLRADGEPLVEVESEIALTDAPAADTAVLAGEFDTSPGRDRLGAIRLGMSSSALRQAVPAARDTTWIQEGMPQSVLAVPLGANQRALAVLDGDSVVRIEVRDPTIRTRERVGVGSSMAELRAAFGQACAGAGEGMMAVWFAGAPGISFALDVPASDIVRLSRAPEQIPATARVTRWWLRRGVDRCPAQAP